MGKKVLRFLGLVVAGLLATGSLPLLAVTCSCQRAHCSASRDCPAGCICTCSDDVCACECLDGVKPPVRIKLPPGFAARPLTARQVLEWLQKEAGIQGVADTERALDRPVCLPADEGGEGLNVAVVLATVERQAGFHLLGPGVPAHNLPAGATLDISLHGLDAERLSAVLTWLSGQEVSVDPKKVQDYNASGVNLETLLSVFGAS